MLLMVLEDDDVPKVVETVMEAARTGNIGDGRIFVTDVLDAYTIRTGKGGYERRLVAIIRRALVPETKKAARSGSA